MTSPGSGSLASHFSSISIDPLDKPNIFWRIVDAKDIVTRLPPGLSDNELNRGKLGDGSELDYSHIGIGIHLNPRIPVGVDLKGSCLGGFYTATEIAFAREQLEVGQAGLAPPNLLRRLIEFIPDFIQDHCKSSNMIIESLHRSSLLDPSPCLLLCQPPKSQSDQSSN